jgi:uracil-DNA glycosylase
MRQGLPQDWAEVLRDELETPEFQALVKAMEAERKTQTIYPPPDETFTAFHLTPWRALKVVLLGQDPYHAAGQAHGLAFSVKPGVKPPPSLNNIYKELKADLGLSPSSPGSLSGWAKQGILLLNTVLTVREGAPASHKGLGWEHFTDAVIRAVSLQKPHAAFVLWGEHAKKKSALIDKAKHTLIEGAHPSPLSQKKWFGSRPFSQINAALAKHGQAPIDFSA